MEISTIVKRQEISPKKCDYPKEFQNLKRLKSFKLMTNEFFFLLNSGLSPKNILIITPLKSQAKEINKYLNKVKSYFFENIYLKPASSFQAFFKMILSDFGHLVGLSNFEIISLEQTLFLLNNKQYNPSNIRKDLSLLIEVFQYKHNEKCNRSIKEKFDKYNNYLKQNNLMDIYDALLLILHLITNNPEVQVYYQRKYKFVFCYTFFNEVIKADDFLTYGFQNPKKFDLENILLKIISFLFQDPSKFVFYSIDSNFFNKIPFIDKGPEFQESDLDNENITINDYDFDSSGDNNDLILTHKQLIFQNYNNRVLKANQFGKRRNSYYGQNHIAEFNAMLHHINKNAYKKCLSDEETALELS